MRYYEVLTRLSGIDRETVSADEIGESHVDYLVGVGALRLLNASMLVPDGPVELLPVDGLMKELLDVDWQSCPTTGILPASVLAAITSTTDEIITAPDGNASVASDHHVEAAVSIPSPDEGEAIAAATERPTAVTAEAEQSAPTEAKPAKKARTAKGAGQ